MRPTVRWSDEWGPIGGFRIALLHSCRFSALSLAVRPCVEEFPSQLKSNPVLHGISLILWYISPRYSAYADVSVLVPYRADIDEVKKRS